MDRDWLDVAERSIKNRRLLEDPKAFFERFWMPYIKVDKRFPFMDFHTEWFNHLRDDPKVVLRAPMGHHKTTVAQLLILMEICRDRDQRIMLCAEGFTEAANIVRPIIWHLEHNDDLINTFGEFKGSAERWGTSEIIVKRLGEHRAPTLRAVGIDTQKIGTRVTRIIADDVMSRRNTMNPDVRKKIIDMFRLEIMSRVDPGGRIGLIGTTWHRNDLYQVLAEEGFTNMTYKAIIDEPSHTVLYPEKWSYEMLCEERDRLGNALFLLAYQNDAAGMAEERAFNEAWLQFLPVPPIDELSFIQVTDPAISRSDKACFTATMTLGYHGKSKRAWLMDVWLRRTGDPAGQIISAVSAAVARGWHVREHKVESVAFQQIIADEVRKRGCPAPVIPLAHHQSDKHMRIHELVPRFKAGDIVINPALKRSPDWPLFMEEYLDFPLALHVDGLDALEMGVRDIFYRPPLKPIAMFTDPRKELKVSNLYPPKDDETYEPI